MQFDKVSILDDTIEYLQELERKVEELESHRAEGKAKDAVERTSDNYGNNKTSNAKKSLVNKRKACEIDELDREFEYAVLKDDSTNNITVSMNDKDVLVEIKCPWREGILLEIMDAVSNLRLDSYSVQSSTTEGILSLTIKTKVWP